jgi:pyruvate formate lyase activating enzyme
MHSPAIYARKLEDGRMECQVCPHACRLGDGQRGRCFVRMGAREDIVLTTYGRSSGFCIDPIEKKPLYHFYPGSPVLSFGTAGCNLSCSFCQNWHLSRCRSMDRLMAEACPEAIAEAASVHGCCSVAYTYNDPVVFFEYAMDTADACREKGIFSVAVTAGYIHGKAREDFFSRMDAANVDLKAFSEDFYKKFCGASLAPVLDTLRYIRRETRIWLEITTLLIPGCNDGEGEIHALCAWILEHLGPEVPLHFTAFHPDFKMAHLERTPLATLIRARNQALSLGLFHVYVGNVQTGEKESTFCPHCKKALIGRAGYRITDWGLGGGGICLACGKPCAGHFGTLPGDWGPRCLPLRF